MGLPGEEGPGVYTGTEFLNKANAGETLRSARRWSIVGGGDTAIDAARVSLRLSSDAAGMSRRLGAEVTILYRRTRAEMPAIAREIEEALEEGIKIEFLAAPARIERDGDGKIDQARRPAHGARRARRLRAAAARCPSRATSTRWRPTRSIMAVSQAARLVDPRRPRDEGLLARRRRLGADRDRGRLVRRRHPGPGAGHDLDRPGPQGRREHPRHAAGRGAEAPVVVEAPIGSDKIKLDYYDEKARGRSARSWSAEERLAHPMDEVDLGIAQEPALEEATRCFSCGMCFGCERCWMYCQSNCFKKIPPPSQGHYYKIDLSICDGCKKCAEECPCGFLDSCSLRRDDAECSSPRPASSSPGSPATAARPSSPRGSPGPRPRGASPWRPSRRDPTTSTPAGSARPPGGRGGTSTRTS